MKRKIAILLAATMTLGAVPTFAVKTDAPKAVNTTTVQSGQTIFQETDKYKPIAVNLVQGASDDNGKKTNVKNYKSYLATRDGMVNIPLNAGAQFDGDIEAGTTFNIKLEGGRFTDTGKDLPSVAYRNATLFLNKSNGNPFVKQFFVKNGILNEANGTGTGESVVSGTDLATVIAALDPTTGIADSIASANLQYAEAPLPTIPYSIDIQDETTATVTILNRISYTDIKDGKINVPESYKIDANKVAHNRNQQAYLSIPLGAVVESTGAEEVKVNIDGYGSKFITDGTVTLARSVGNGSTSIDTKYIDKKVFEYDFTPSDIIIRENIRGTFNNTDLVTVRLGSGFEFVGTGANVKVTKATDENTSVLDASTQVTITDKNKITFKIDTTKLNSQEKEAIKIKLPKIAPVDEAKNYGEVSVNIYGGGITDETVVIGERQQLGFKLETKTDVPTITKGRYAKLNDTLKQNGNETAEFEFSEVVPESLLTARNLDFNVPAGVKIVDAQLISMTGLGYSASASNFDGAFSIKNDGTTLRVERNSLRDTDTKGNAKLRLKLWLSIDAGFEGEEVKLSVAGGGSNETYETVIAKVQAPFKVEAKSKDINIGYQDYAVNDIVIEETAPGMFMEGEEIKLQITAPYGTSEMGFTKAKVTSEGEIEIAPLSGKTGDEYGYLNTDKTSDANNAIVIRVKTKSTKNPAKITISDVKVGTTRSVPFGAYNLTISGKSLINNDLLNDNDKFINGYDAKDKSITGLSFKLDNAQTTTSEEKAKRVDVTTSNFVVPGYINVITANNTIDSEVKVSIGNTNASINGKEVAMDVAPYIQGTGNTMVPLRFVAVALAGGDATSVEAAQNSEKVSWDPVTKTVTVFYGAGIGQKIIQFKIGSTSMIVDGNVIPMENGAKAEIKNGRTFVPFRALGQALGVSVSWDETTKTAIYNQQ